MAFYSFSTRRWNESIEEGVERVTETVNIKLEEVKHEVSKSMAEGIEKIAETVKIALSNTH